MVTSKQAQDYYDYWHLQYEGNLELDEFMKFQTGWTDMELDYWTLSGNVPEEENANG